MRAQRVATATPKWVHDIFVGWRLARKIDCQAHLKDELAATIPIPIPIPTPMEN